MALPQSSFVIKKYDSFGGKFIDSEYLGAAFETGKPAMLENVLTKIYSSRNRFFTGEKNILGMTGAKTGGTTEIDTEIYRWRLQGAEEKSARSVENLEASNATPGINNTTFRIKLDLDYYSYPEVLMAEDNAYIFQIVEGPISDGTGYIYTCRLQTDDPTKFIPTAMLDAGREFDKVWTTVPSEFNQWGGGQQYPDIFMLEHQVSAFAQHLTVTDKAWREEGRLGFHFLSTDRNGKTTEVKKFLNVAESKMWDELYNSMEAQVRYGTKTTSAGKEGYWVKTGSGVREQLRDGWTQYFNGPINTTMLRDYVMDIFFTRSEETDRKVTFMTGTLGAMLFHDALASAANGFLTVDTHFVEKTKGIAGVETPHLAYGAQFTRYRGPEGVVIDLLKDSMYDSRKYCKRMHPDYPNMPIDSARFTCLDFGTTEGNNNIRLLKVKDSFSWGYVPGTWSPTGPLKGGMGASRKAGYDMWAQGTAGVAIIDVTRTGELIYDNTY